MPRIVAALAFFGVLLAMPDTVCAQTRSEPASSSPGTPIDSDYILGVADKLRVVVFDEPSLSGEFTVNANGAISLPLIGEVQAATHSVSDLRGAIESKFADGYLVHPRVSIEVLSFRPFYILGEVNKPGEYPYSNGLTVMNAVATAQGFTYRANKKRVFIKHAKAQEEIQVKLDAATPVAPGDTIRIGERYF